MPLGQIEAFEAAPPKRLLVPESHVSWWGVDSSTLRVAIATISPERRRGASLAAFDKRTPVIDRLVEIRRQTLSLARGLLDVGLAPGVIAVETPAGFGDRPNPSLAYAVGAILCGLGEACPLAGIVMVESARWKKVSCGSGAIRKPKPTSGEEYAVLTWARTVGYKGTSWDEADSYGIAEWARRTYKLEVR